MAGQLFEDQVVVITGSGRGNTGNPLGRPGVPEEGAGGIFLMASPLASYITGHCLEVTGGSGI